MDLVPGALFWGCFPYCLSSATWVTLLGTALGTQVVGVNAAHADFLAAVFKKSKLSKNQQNRDEGL